jgi:hypothetical protein
MELSIAGEAKETLEEFKDLISSLPPGNQWIMGGGSQAYGPDDTKIESYTSVDYQREWPQCLKHRMVGQVPTRSTPKDANQKIPIPYLIG